MIVGVKIIYKTLQTHAGLFQLLTVGGDTEAPFEFSEFDGTEIEALNKKMKQSLMESVQTNQLAKERILSLAKEAGRRNII